MNRNQAIYDERVRREEAKLKKHPAGTAWNGSDGVIEARIWVTTKPIETVYGIETFAVFNWEWHYIDGRTGDCGATTNYQMARQKIPLLRQYRMKIEANHG